MDIRSVGAAYGAKPLEPSAQKSRKAAPEKTAAAQTEQVELSSASVKLQSISMDKLNAIIDATPDVRLKVVEEIRWKIKHNGYPLESNIYKAIENMATDKII